MSRTLVRRSILPLFLCACAGDFSVNYEGSTSNSSSGSESSSGGPGSSSGTGETAPADTSSDETGGSSSSSETTQDLDTSSEASSSSESGCTMVEECFPCTAAEDPDGACASAFPDRPLCGPEGTCIQCTAESPGLCTGTTPVCGTEGSCVGCAFHSECPTTACNMETGACFDETCVREVDGDGGQDFSSVAAALGDECVVIVHERNAGVPYTEALGVEGITVAILAAPGEKPVLQGVGGGATMGVMADGFLFAEGVILRGNTDGTGIAIADSTVYLDRVEITQNAGGGLDADGSAVRMRNTFVAGNGGNSFSDTTGIRLQDSDAEISYVSVVFNEGDAADSFQCAGATGTLRNSIVLGSDPSSFDCPGVTASYTAFDDSVAGIGNDDVSPAQGSWFVNPTSNFHLTAAGQSTFEDIAVWDVGDPAVDIDGDSRPNIPDTADVAGADVP